MTLGFSTKIKDKFTRFPEKIWQSLMQDLGVTDEIYFSKVLNIISFLN